MNNMLTRSTNDNFIAGICGGVAERYNIDSLLVRISAILLGVLTAGMLIVAYAVVWSQLPAYSGTTKEIQ